MTNYLFGDHAVSSQTSDRSKRVDFIEENYAERCLPRAPEDVRSDQTKMVAKLARKLESKRLSTHFSIQGWDSEQCRFRFSEKEKIGRDEKYAGVWVLRTDVKDKQALELVKMYKGLLGS